MKGRVHNVERENEKPHAHASKEEARNCNMCGGGRTSHAHGGVAGKRLDRPGRKHGGFAGKKSGLQALLDEQKERADPQNKESQEDGGDGAKPSKKPLLIEQAEKARTRKEITP